MNEHEVLTLIQQGESQSLDRKRQLGNSIQLAEHLCAFANTDLGASLLFDIADDGTVIGIDNPDHAANMILNVSRYSISPPLRPIIEQVGVQGKTVLIVTLKGIDRPY